MDFLKLWQFDDPEQTERLFVEQLDQLSGDELATLKTQIARTYSLRRQFDQAKQWLTGASDLLGDHTPYARTYYHLELGRTHNSAGDKDKARIEFKQALTHAVSRQQEALALDAVHMLAIADQGTDDELLWNLVGLRLAEASEDEKARGWLGPLYNNIGWTYFDQGDFDTALLMFQKGVAFREEKGQRRPLQIAWWTVARTFRAMSRSEEALEIQQRLLAELQEDGSEDGYVHEELGELYLLGSDSRASTHFAEAHRLLSADSWMVENEGDRLARLKALADK